ncbi:SOS response-associated peptidase family protein [Mesorhizobium sp. M0496]|uniref:SOS response-associated peptidase family protein n=1 Tax=Mesorhizobium sp. M0496 TaxID=2956952 RepID=UPI003339DC47
MKKTPAIASRSPAIRADTQSGHVQCKDRRHRRGAAFRDAFKSKRCLIPADGFYEWTISPADGKKDPWHVYQPKHAPFSSAGLWPITPTSISPAARSAAGYPRSGLLRRLARLRDAQG